MNQTDELYNSGILAFNRKEYFEAHEILECLYHTQTGSDREFTQGLIQIAVAFYHLSKNNFLGGKKLLVKGIIRIKNNQANFSQFKLEKLIEYVENLIFNLEQNHEISLCFPSIEILETNGC